MVYKNPIPVIVGIVFKSDRDVYLIQRAIAPNIGGWALPSGYIEEGDDWRERLQKEVKDEACLDISTDPKYMKMYEGRTTPDGKLLLLFATVSRDGVKERRFKRNAEASGRKTGALDMYSCPQLCFPLHSEVLRQHGDEHWKFEDQHPGGW